MTHGLRPLGMRYPSTQHTPQRAYDAGLRPLGMRYPSTQHTTPKHTTFTMPGKYVSMPWLYSRIPLATSASFHAPGAGPERNRHEGLREREYPYHRLVLLPLILFPLLLLILLLHRPDEHTSLEARGQRTSNPRAGPPGCAKR